MHSYTKLYWQAIKIRNEYYWSLYDNKYLTSFLDFTRRPELYLRIGIISASARLKGRKLIVIYLLYRGHWAWVEGIAKRMAQNGRFQILILTHDSSFSIQAENILVFQLNYTKLFRGMSLLPITSSDLYLTPASVTGTNARLIQPKVHFFHSLASIFLVYEDDTFRDYDYFYCAGPHHVDELREWFAERNLKGKCLIPGGYPRLDSVLARRAKLGKSQIVSQKNTVIFAPSLLTEKTEGVSALFANGKKIVAALLANGLNVIFRPHPVNLEKGNPYFPMIEEIILMHSKHPQFTLDRAVDYFATYEASDLMITDFSGTGFTFGFGFEKPVVFFSVNEAESSLQRGVEFRNRRDVGKVIANVDELAEGCLEILANFDKFQKQVLEFRNRFLFRVGESEEYFIKNMSYIMSNRRHPDWTYID